jgi:hypothetical protein
MKNLILLVAVAAGVLATDQPALDAGAQIPNVPDDVADKLIADGTAKLDEPAVVKPAKAGKPVKVRVLSDCAYGFSNQVVTFDSAAMAKDAEAAGLVDSTPAAVAYAESLVKGAD